MFTGIVQAVGVVTGIEDSDELRRLVIEAPVDFLQGVEPGASIAIDGACLTPVRVQSESFEVEAVGSTRRRTIAGEYARGSRVNLERALALGGGLDGHLVQGHIDGVGNVTSVRDEGGARLLEVRIPSEVHDLTLLHGSITLNGVSLTVNRMLEGDRIEVALIPHTWSHTNLSGLAPGHPLNVEGDLIGKYVGKLLGNKREGAREGDAGESAHAV